MLTENVASQWKQRLCLLWLLRQQYRSGKHLQIAHKTQSFLLFLVFVRGPWGQVILKMEGWSLSQDYRSYLCKIPLIAPLWLWCGHRALKGFHLGLKSHRNSIPMMQTWASFKRKFDKNLPLAKLIPRNKTMSLKFAILYSKIGCSIQMSTVEWTDILFSEKNLWPVDWDVKPNAYLNVRCKYVSPIARSIKYLNARFLNVKTVYNAMQNWLGYVKFPSKVRICMSLLCVLAI